jgi:hypothetical protein
MKPLIPGYAPAPERRPNMMQLQQQQMVSQPQQHMEQDHVEYNGRFFVEQQVMQPQHMQTMQKNRKI